MRRFELLRRRGWHGLMAVGLCSVAFATTAHPARSLESQEKKPSENQVRSVADRREVKAATAKSTTPAPEESSADASDYPGARRFGLWDYIGTGAALATYYTVEFTMDGPSSVHWHEPVPLIDEPMRDLFVLESRDARETADRISDYFWYVSTGYPVISAIAAPIVRGKSFDYVWQLGMMNLQAYAVASLIVRLPHKLIGRLRPNAIGCAEDPNYSDHCGAPAQRVSFFGGHTAISMTGAGLACAHHLHADLFGGGVADDVACGAALTGASAVFVTRLQTDKHWMSDQLVAVLVGLGIGYGMPTWLYYKPFWRSAADENPKELGGSNWLILPEVYERGLGAQWVGRF